MISRVCPPLLSPGIQTEGAADKAAPWLAFELKFVIAEELAQAISTWGREHLDLDPYADLETGAYQTTTLYLDTPEGHVFNRMPGFRRRKFRVRRYGSDMQIHLERKTRRKDLVRKRRITIPDHELGRLAMPESAAEWAGDWFHQRLLRRTLQPACCVTYDRTAFMKLTPSGVLRLTLDRNIRGVPCNRWDLQPVTHGNALLPGQVVCELKFRDTMPQLFKQLVTDQKLAPGNFSKFRQVLQAAGYIPKPPAEKLVSETVEASPVAIEGGGSVHARVVT